MKLRADLKSHRKAMGGLVKNVLGESERVLKAVSGGDDKKIRERIETLKFEVKNMSNRLYERPAGRA